MAAYTAIDDPEAHFQVKTYTGTGSSNALTLDGDTDMAVDVVWIDTLNEAEINPVMDRVRGTAEYGARTNATDTDDESNANTITAFGSDGFTVGTENRFNQSSNTFVAWCWLAGGSGSANTSGSINTTKTSANATGGFSLMTYTGNDTAGATIGHGLGAVPHFVVVKCRSATQSWCVYHHKMATDPETDAMNLDTDAAKFDNANRWNDTAPTSTLITLGDENQVNGALDYFAWAWTEKQGYSKFGSFMGNGDAEGPFVYTGFRPAWVMMKHTNDGSTWMIMDHRRSGYNPTNNRTYANTTTAQESAVDRFDILSNGFKIKTADNDTNPDGAVMIYMAFARQPFVNSNGVPCNAR